MRVKAIIYDINHPEGYVGYIEIEDENAVQEGESCT